MMRKETKAAILATLAGFAILIWREGALARDDAPAQETGSSAQTQQTPESIEAPSADEVAGTPAATEEGPAQAEETPTPDEQVPVQAQDNLMEARGSIVQVVVLGSSDEVQRIGSGFVATAGRVLTAAHLVRDESRIVVVPLATRTELVARIAHLNERSDLALLAVNGLHLPALKFAKDGFAPGRLVYSAGVWDASGESLPIAAAEGQVPLSLAQGAVGKHIEIPAAADAPALGLIQHNAMIPTAGYGGPLLNECGEVAGLNRGAPGLSIWRLRRGEAPKDAVHAAGVEAVAGLLQPAGVAFAQSDASCTEARTAAEARAAAAQAQAGQAQAQADQAQAQAGEAQAQAQQAQAQADQAQAEATEAARQAEDKGRQLEAVQARVGELETEYQEAVRTGAAEAGALRTDLDAARDEAATLADELAALRIRAEDERKAERRQLIAIVIAAAVLVLLIVIAAVAVQRKRSRELAHAQQQAAQAQQEVQRARVEAVAPDFPDCLLAGETGEGRPVSIKLPGSLLAREGVVVGRSPRHSTTLIDDKTLSREHARFFAEDGSLHLEDLGATNGTQVNGRRIPPRTPAVVAQGDLVELGAVKVQVSWVS